MRVNDERAIRLIAVRQVIFQDAEPILFGGLAARTWMGYCDPASAQLALEASLKAVEYLRLTVQNAWRRFAYAEGITISEHALQLTERLPETERIAWEMRFREIVGTLAHVSYEPSRALEALETLASRAAAYGMPDVEARALTYQIVLRSCQDSGACVPLMERMRTLSSEQKGPLAICVFGWNPQLARGHAEALEELRQNGDRLSIASKQMDHCYIEWLSSRYADCIQHAQQSLPALLEAGQVMRFLLGRDLVALNLLLLGEWGKALDMLDESVRSANKNAASHRAATPLLYKAWIHLNMMDYRGVLELCANALPMLDEVFTLDRCYLASFLRAAAESRLGSPDKAVDQQLDLRERITRHPVMLKWYWRIPLQLELVDARLAMHDLFQARLEADQMVEAALATAERTWQALAWDASTRVALREGNVPRAEDELRNAFDAMHGFDVPMAAWRVHKTAALMSGDSGNLQLRDFHLARAREVVTSLTNSLAARPELRQIFRSSPVIFEITGDDHELAANI